MKNGLNKFCTVFFSPLTWCRDWLVNTIAASVHGSRFTVHSAIALTLTLVLNGCGFQLRGSYELPYKTLHVTSTGSAIIASQIRRELTDTPTKLMNASKDADATLTIIEERRDRQILSLSGAGRAVEYELRLAVTYQFIDKSGTVIIPTSQLDLKRILVYNERQVIASQQEEALLYQDMERDATGQILRRMIAVNRRT
jgi:LPS-assembly lipoprotein